MNKDIKLNENYFWIEQQIGCSFPFICKDGIVNFVMEQDGRPREELSLDGKVYLILKERFEGKHIKELYAGIQNMRPYMLIKNYFVADQFEKHNIFIYRRLPENWEKAIIELEGYVKHLNTDKGKKQYFYWESQIEIYNQQIKDLKDKIKKLPTSPDYVNAKVQYDTNVVHKMRMLHGIVYGYNNVVDFS